MRVSFYLLVISLVLASSYVHSETRESLSVIPVKTLPIPANRLLVSGSVAARKSVVLSAQMPGRITAILGEEGDRFKKDDFLVKIKMMSCWQEGKLL